jgi:hypothetical protein
MLSPSHVRPRPPSTVCLASPCRHPAVALPHQRCRPRRDSILGPCAAGDTIYVCPSFAASTLPALGYRSSSARYSPPSKQTLDLVQRSLAPCPASDRVFLFSVYRLRRLFFLARTPHRKHVRNTCSLHSRTAYKHTAPSWHVAVRIPVPSEAPLYVHRNPSSGFGLLTVGLVAISVTAIASFAIICWD